MQSGWTAVMIACENGHLDIVRVLVDKQANVNHRNKVGLIFLLYLYTVSLFIYVYFTLVIISVIYRRGILV